MTMTNCPAAGFPDGVELTCSTTQITEFTFESPGCAPRNGSLSLRNVQTGRIISSSVGTVSYGTGEIEINGITPTALPNNILDFRITATIQEGSQNLRAVRNQILVVDETILNAAVGREAGLTVNVTAI